MSYSYHYLKRNVCYEVAGGYCEDARRAVNALLGRNLPAVLNESEHGIFIYLIPEAENGKADISVAVNERGADDLALIVGGSYLCGISVLRLVDILRLAVDIHALALNAEYVGLLSYSEIGDEHLGVEVQIVVVGVVAVLVGVDVDVVNDLIVVYLGREGYSAVLVGVEVELVRNVELIVDNVAVLVHRVGRNEGNRVRGNYDVNVLDSHVVGALDVDEIIVGLNRAVGNLAYYAIACDIALTPGDITGVLLVVVCVPAILLIVTVLLLEVGGEGGVRIIVDLLCGDGNELGYVVYGGEARTVTEGSRAYGDLLLSANYDLLDVGVAVECGIVDLDYARGHVVVNALYSGGVAVEDVEVLGVENAVRIVSEALVVLGYHDLLES